MTSNAVEVSTIVAVPFRDKQVPVTGNSALVQEAIHSVIFRQWLEKCASQSEFHLHGIEIQSVDFFGARGVGFVKLKADMRLLRDGVETRLPGICFLRGHAVSVMISLFCNDKQYSILVEQPRVPIGQASILELPAGMLDDESHSIAGTAIRELQEECGITVDPEELVDLFALAFDQTDRSRHLQFLRNGVPPSAGGCDECVKYFYLEKQVTESQLHDMQGRLTGLRDHGEVITLHIVPLEDVWKVSADSKAMICLFLIDQLRQQGKLPEAGALATPLVQEQQRQQEEKALVTAEPTLLLSNGMRIPQMAFGLYLVPDDPIGEQIVLDALKAGYRHFDGASFYGNESMLGRALQKCRTLSRQELFLTGKVWNDAVRQGRAAVRASVETSLRQLGCKYFDLFLVHWPVPGCFVDAYKELEELYREGKLRAIGISNFDQEDYRELIDSGITVLPVVNQLEVSPVMYRPELIEFFQERDIAVCAFKSINRGGCLNDPVLMDIAQKHSVTTAQVMLRWGLQKNLIIISKTATPSRLKENRSITDFVLDSSDMERLDSLTTEDAKAARAKRELESKRNL